MLSEQRIRKVRIFRWHFSDHLSYHFLLLWWSKVLHSAAPAFSDPSAISNGYWYNGCDPIICPMLLKDIYRFVFKDASDKSLLYQSFAVKVPCICDHPLGPLLESKYRNLHPRFGQVQMIWMHLRKNLQATIAKHFGLFWLFWLLQE